MSITNPLEKLTIEYWYHALMIIGIVVFLLAGAGILKSFPLIPTSTISLGLFFFGLGEWRNHPLQTSLQPASLLFPAGIITGHPRSPSIIGIAFELVGIILIGFGIYKLFSV